MEKQLPDDIKFFIEQTRLEKHVGLAFMAFINLIEGNTLDLPGGNYLLEDSYRIDYSRIDFKSFKL